MLYGEKYALIYVKKYDQDDFIQHLKKNLSSKGRLLLRYSQFTFSPMAKWSLWQKGLLVSKNETLRTKSLLVMTKNFVSMRLDTPKNLGK